MKKLLNTSALGMIFLSMLFTSCITVVDQGPRGNNGKVFFGIDYDFNPPYSYWDNNSNVPLNPYFGEYYRTQRGTYDFEYFINPYEYWYGTYTLHMNLGAQGEAYGVRGRNGDDTYMLLICNDDGFYYEGWDDCNCYRTMESDGSVTISGKDAVNGSFEINMKKTSVDKRAPHRDTKFKSPN